MCMPADSAAVAQHTLTSVVQAQDAKDAMPELSDRPKLPSPLVAPPASSLLPSFPAAAGAGADAAGDERLVSEGDAAIGHTALVAISGPSSTATALQVPAVLCVALVTVAPLLKALSSSMKPRSASDFPPSAVMIAHEMSSLWLSPSTVPICCARVIVSS